MNARCLLTCEHASNAVPSRYRRLFEGRRDVLETHRGYDPGTRVLGDLFQRKLRAPLHVGEASRLLVELNRSLGHPALFSEFTRGLDPSEREAVLNRYYHSYRGQVRSRIARWVQQRRPVVHLSLHSFTPELQGEVRHADVGLLYDPRRVRERDFCLHWQALLQDAAPHLRVRRNYPYQGKADGFTTALRREFPEAAYAGIELEVNQKWTRPTSAWRRLGALLADTFAATFQELLA
jgi:predicted N-formylglutamate amidohydrolase